MLKVYGDLNSGNCYKVKLLLHLLDIEHEWIEVNILKQETHTEEFRKLNPNGKIPVLVMDRGDVLWESNAILNYLADGTSYLPSKKFIRSKILQWQFFEQYSHEPYIAVARYIKVYLGLPDSEKARYESCLPKGYKALDVMEEQLRDQVFLAGDFYTIADISLYAYTHVAEQGGFDLSKYPSIVNWMSRIESRLKHQTMQDFIAGSTRKKRAEQRLLNSVLEMTGSHKVITGNHKIIDKPEPETETETKEVVESSNKSNKTPRKKRGFVKDILGMLGSRKQEDSNLFVEESGENFEPIELEGLRNYTSNNLVIQSKEKENDIEIQIDETLDDAADFSETGSESEFNSQLVSGFKPEVTNAKDDFDDGAEPLPMYDIDTSSIMETIGIDLYGNKVDYKVDNVKEKTPIGDSQPEKEKFKSTDSAADETIKSTESRSFHELLISDINGRELGFSNFKDKVVLIVNVASECGYTSQYRGLHLLHEKYMNRGFFILGIPCNQFGGQEPGSEAEIKSFCTLNYDVMFPMTSKVDVNGPRKHPLYDVLTGEDAEYPGDITWNFEKFLVGKDGKVIKRFAPAVEPTASELMKEIERALAV